MLEELAARRFSRQMRDGEPWVTDYAGACSYVEEQGIVIPWSAKGYPLPCLRAVFRGEIKREPGPIWDWKDRMPLERKAYYGALLRHAKILLAPRLAPAFYRASGRTGDAEDYLSDYDEGTLSRLSKQVIDVLRDGPCLTNELRERLKKLGADVGHLQQDMDELQARFYITKADVLDNGKQYGYIWGLVDESWPELAAAAKSRAKPEARADVALELLRAAVYLKAADFGRMVGWGKERIAAALSTLEMRGVVGRLADEDVYYAK